MSAPGHDSLVSRFGIARASQAYIHLQYREILVCLKNLLNQSVFALMTVKRLKYYAQWRKYCEINFINKVTETFCAKVGGIWARELNLNDRNL